MPRILPHLQHSSVWAINKIIIAFLFIQWKKIKLSSSSGFYASNMQFPNQRFLHTSSLLIYKPRNSTYHLELCILNLSIISCRALKQNLAFKNYRA